MINRIELLKALEVVKPGLANKDLIEQTTCFAFMDGNVVTYNDEISIRHPIEIDISGAVQAGELYSLLNKLTSDEIKVELTDNEILLSAGRIRSGLTLYQEISLPLDELGTIQDWYTLPKDFIEAMSFCLFSCSKDMSRPILTCVHINGQIIESCDNQRLTQFTMDSPLNGEPLLIPVSSASQLIKYKLKEAAPFDNGWVHFKTDEGTVISCRVYEDNYVDLSNIINQAHEGKELKLPASTSETLDRAGIFTKQDFDSDQTVSISFSDKRMKVRAENEVGWIEEELNLLYDDEPVQFSIHPKLLQDILKKTNEFQISDGKIKFAKDNWIHVVALRAEEQTATEEQPVKKSRKKPSDSIPRKIKTAVTEAAKESVGDDVEF